MALLLRGDATPVKYSRRVSDAEQHDENKRYVRRHSATQLTDLTHGNHRYRPWFSRIRELYETGFFGEIKYRHRTIGANTNGTAALGTQRPDYLILAIFAMHPGRLSNRSS
jgi:hypothetical protein